MGASPRQPAPRPLAASPPSEVVSGEHATATVFAPLAFGEAPRVGILGDSGTGKTEAARRLVAAYVARVPGVALVIDDKELRPRFEGQQYRDVADVRARPPAAEPRVLVFRGEPSRGVQVDAESVAEFGWQLTARRRPALVVYDELERAAEDGDWLAHVKKIPAGFKQGRAVGLSSLWGTQSPQDVPRAAFEQASCILCFRLDGLGLNLLRRRGYVFEPDLESTIRLLPGDELPPAERGYFVLLRRGRPWDRHVYRYGAI